MCLELPNKLINIVERREQLRKTASLAILSTFLLVAAAVAAPLSADPGPVPTAFWGAVTINEDPAPAGIEVKAYMEGSLLGTAETGPTAELPDLEDNEYSMSVWGTDDDIGNTVSFVVTYEAEEYAAAETGTFEYAASNVDLSIEIEVGPSPPGPVMTGFYGEVTVDDDPAPLGTEVRAYMGGSLLGSAETGATAELPDLEDNEYWLSASGTEDDIGRAVNFVVTYEGDDYAAAETGTFEMEAQRVDLTVSTEEPVAAPSADFSGSPRIGGAPLRVEFTDESEGDIDSWDWDFGDGSTSSAENPAHVYKSMGKYDVSLTVTGAGGSDTETKRNYITALAPGMVPPEAARFAASYLLISPEEVLPDQEVQISINIANHGGEEGSHTVTVYINGYAEKWSTVSVSPGSSQNVVFSVSKSVAGVYQVSVEGQEGQFTVVALPAAEEVGFWGGPLGTGGIIVIVVIAIVLALGLIFGLRRE